MPPPPPAPLRALVDLLGVPGTLALLEAHAGTRLYVAKTPGAAMVSLLGAEAAAALAGAMGGDYLHVPSAKRWRAILYRARGESYARIARRLGIDENSVGRYLREAGVTRRQMELEI